MSRQLRKRRGIVLLVVVSLLVLFVLAGLTYAIVAGQFRAAAETASRRDQLGDDPRKQLDTVMYDLLRDTNYRTPLQHHSLLGDLYGNDGVMGRVHVNPPPAFSGGGQFIDFGVLYQAFNPPFGRPFKPLNHYYAGCVLTMLEGPFAGRSTRVVDYSNDPTGIFIRVETFDSDAVPNVATVQEALIDPTTNVGYRFLINGQAFNGTGFGYHVDPLLGSPPSLDLKSAEGKPVVLLPHFSAHGTSPAYPVDQGGADESWDVADYQNMLLAFVPTNPLDTTAMVSGVIPSLHRPDLINYWRNDASALSDPTNANYRDFRRKYIFRPMPWDHPTFTGSNPNFTPRDIDGDGSLWVGNALESDSDLMNALIHGMGGSNSLNGNPMPLWDVDNDGDGIPDSIWIDIGLPVQTSADGRSFRPLVAILVKDLDGRLNLNAHGNGAQTSPLFTSLATGPLEQVPNVVASGRFAGGPYRQVLGLPRGLGYGPAEIFFGHALNPANANNEYQQLLAGRYGVDANAGLLGINEPLSSLQAVGLPADFGLTLSAYSSRPDIHGVGAIGLEYYGQPLSFYMADTSQVPSQILDDPYEADLSARSRGTGGSDASYTYLELEHLLRWADSDSAGISERLYQRAPTSFAPGAGLSWSQAWQRRELFTTDSWHVPQPNFSVPRETRSLTVQWLPGEDLAWGKLNVDDNGDGSVDDLAEAGAPNSDDVPNLPGSIVELLAIKLQANGLNPLQINAEVAKLLPVELLQGRPMDINRLWGNGFDDNNNFVVDEPFEGDGIDNDGDGTIDNEPGDILLGTGTYYDNVPINENNGAPAPMSRMGRQIFARNLFCLLMLLGGDLGRDLDGNNTISPQEKEETALQLAQFAINVVDFRDADSIMTPFEVDLNPFDGWGVDGDLTTDENPPPPNAPTRRVMWGCERPELLITETLAFHDRRTEDLTVGQKVSNGDTDYDQRLRPRGSFFVELYNPWSTSHPQGSHKLPAEFYEPGGGVQLNRFVPGPAGNSPVWRMLIVRGPGINSDPDDPDPAKRPTAIVPPPDLPDIERSVYFTDPSFVGDPIIGDPRDGSPYWTTMGLAPLRPGHYAVVGSSGQTVDSQAAPLDLDGNGLNEFMTTIGRTTTAAEGASLEYDQTRRIVLEPSIDPNHSQVKILGNQTLAITNMPIDPTGPPGVEPTQILPVVAVPINQPRSLSVSEPVGGYEVYEVGPFDPALADYEGAYLNPQDEPLDSSSPDASKLAQNATHPSFRNVHLQRLANPLVPWHPTINPYLTIDSMTVDLTTFNGVTNDSDEPNTAGGPTDFASKERGSKTSSTDGGAPYTWRNLWAHEPPNTGADVVADPMWAEPGPVTHHFPNVLKETLGYLNHDFHPFFTNPGTDPSGSGLYRGAPDTINPPVGGVPPGWVSRLPGFPWLAFHDRPFANPMELLQVPMTRSSQLGQSFGTADRKSVPPLPMPNRQEQYSGTSPAPFPHLLDFFHSQPQTSARVLRLFDYVETPSRFSGTRTWYPPASMFGIGGLQPPFSWTSRFRDPGRVNINTLTDPYVWFGIAKCFPAMDTFAMAREVMMSRRGYGGLSPLALDPAGNYPTFFTNPFRAATSADLMPGVLKMRKDGSVPDKLEVHATLLRGAAEGDWTVPATDTLSDIPLFRFESQLDPQGAGERTEYDNSDRNSYFRYHGLQRLSNLVTTHSNVYGVWITMGYFEVEPNIDPPPPAPTRRRPPPPSLIRLTRTAID